MGNIEAKSGEVVLIYSTEEGAETSRAKHINVTDALAAAYQNNLDGDAASSFQLEAGGKVIYDLEAMADAIDRMNVVRAEAFVNGGNASVEEAAAQVAREDGHSS